MEDVNWLIVAILGLSLVANVAIFVLAFIVVRQQETITELVIRSFRNDTK